MDDSRFDRLARALGRRGTRRSTIAAAFAAVTGGVVLAGDRAGAAVCTGEGASCATVGCCAGLACDSETQTCLGGPGATCRVSSHCASGLKCKRGVCDGALVCRALRETCVPTAASCCGNLSCVAGEHVCLGMAGYRGCTEDADCVSGLVCFAGTCQLKPTPISVPSGMFGDVDCSLFIEPGTDLVPLYPLAAGVTACLAPGDHYLVTRFLCTDAAGGSIYGAADGSTTIYSSTAERTAIEMNGPGTLANLTIKATSDHGSMYVVHSRPAADAGTVVIDNVVIDVSATGYVSAIQASYGSTTIKDSTLIGNTGGHTLIAGWQGSVTLVGTTVDSGNQGLFVLGGASATMDADSAIIDHDKGAPEGAAVAIYYEAAFGGGSFTNNGGTITGNVSSHDTCDNDVLILDTESDERICCTAAGNGQTGSCAYDGAD